MTVVSAKDIDAQMGKGVDPNSLPTHTGGSHGAMQARFLAQAEHVDLPAGYGQRGASEANVRELPDANHYGSGTVISLSEAPPLLDKMEPKRPDVMPMPGPAPATTPVPVAQTAQQVIAKMGLFKPKAK